MTGRAHPLVVTPVVGMPEVTAANAPAPATGATGRDRPRLSWLAQIITASLCDNRIELRDGDVLVLSSKVVSKALGLRASAQDRATVVLGQSRRVVAERRTEASVTRIVEAVAGPVMAAAGVDASNTGADDLLLLLPQDPDACALALLQALTPAREPRGRGGPDPRIGLVLSDTAGRPWREGQTDFALGAAGLPVLDDLRGTSDADGRSLAVTVRCLADELAAAADLVKGKDRRIALAHVRGLPPATGPAEAVAGAGSLVRTGPTDWFSLGSYEAVRAALGVTAGTAEAERIGIPSVAPEDRATRLRRAVSLAVLGLDGVETELEVDGVALHSLDPVRLGRMLGRLPVALWAERLTGTIDHRPGSDRAIVTVRDRD